VLRTELIGVSSAFFTPLSLDASLESEPLEVRVRVAAQTSSRADAELVTRVVEALYTNGPAGGGGVTRSVTPIVGITSGFIPRDRVQTKVYMEVAQ